MLRRYLALGDRWSAWSIVLGNVYSNDAVEACSMDASLLTSPGRRCVLEKDACFNQASQRILGFCASMSADYPDTGSRLSYYGRLQALPESRLGKAANCDLNRRPQLNTISTAGHEPRFHRQERHRAVRRGIEKMEMAGHKSSAFSPTAECRPLSHSCDKERVLLEYLKRALVGFPTAVGVPDSWTMLISHS